MKTLRRQAKALEDADKEADTGKTLGVVFGLLIVFAGAILLFSGQDNSGVWVAVIIVGGVLARWGFKKHKSKLDEVLIKIEQVKGRIAE